MTGSPTESPTKLPSWLVGAVVLLTALPVVLNLFGVSFASPAIRIGEPRHMILAWVAICTALFAAFLALSHYSITREITTAVIAAAFLVAGLVDAFKALAIDGFLMPPVVDREDFVPFAWVLGRTASALILILGPSLLMFGRFRKIRWPLFSVLVGSLIMAAIAYVVVFVCADVNDLPAMKCPGFAIHPWGLLPLSLFVFSGVFVMPRLYRRFPSVFSHALWISMAPQIMADAYIVFRSGALFDNAFNVAHYLKWLGYLVPFVSLMFSFVAAFRETVEARVVAERANTAKSGFLASMSHELRTPLNSIIGFTRLLFENGTDRPEQERIYLDRVLNNGLHLLKLINEILDLSKIEAGRMTVEIADVPLKKLVEDTAAQFEAQVREKGLDLRLDLPEHLGTVRADATRFRQVLTNLIGNAVKFTDRGQVVIRARAEEDTGVPLSLEVTDSGVGIPAADRQRIFEPFRQLDDGSSRKYSGTGLGLTISRSFLTLMGFGIEVESAPEKGSTFRILFRCPQFVGGGEDRRKGFRELRSV